MAPIKGINYKILLLIDLRKYLVSTSTIRAHNFPYYGQYSVAFMECMEMGLRLGALDVVIGDFLVEGAATDF